MTVTTGMIGAGFYNRNSAPQWSATEYVLPWVEGAALDMELAEPPSTIGLADYGCSEGRNSIAVMTRLVAACRTRTARPIQTIHSDLATNDFSELFKQLRPEGLRPKGLRPEGLRPEGARPEDRTVYGDSDVYSAAVGGSMFDQLLPPRSLHFATTFNAIGFMARRPLDRLPGYILPNGPSKTNSVGHVSDEDRQAFADQAAVDLEAFLQARAVELVPGGKLLIQVFGAGEDYRTCDGIYDVLNDAMLELLDEGMLSQDGYETFYQPVYFRTLDELTAPFAEAEASCAPLFRLERAETYEVPVPFEQDLRETGDVGRYANAYTNFLRAFTEPVLRLHFHDHPSVAAAIEQIYRRIETLLRKMPDRYTFHYVALAALLTRKD